MYKKRKPEPYPIPKVCPYCNSTVIYTSNAEIYGRAYGKGKCYKCTHCDAYVGVHNDLKTPLGRMANAELRYWKKRCHAMFDPIWRTREVSRGVLYKRLAKHLDIPLRECHFGWFDVNEYADGEYTGYSMILQITYILDNPEYCKEGYVVLGLAPVHLYRRGDTATLASILQNRNDGVPVYIRPIKLNFNKHEVSENE